jgi:hypothetical protein
MGYVPATPSLGLYRKNQMLMQVADLVPGLPPISIITVVGVSMMAVTGLLYLISRIPELLLLTIISMLYAAVPLLPLLKHV